MPDALVAPTSQNINGGSAETAFTPAATGKIAQLWTACHVLRDDGLSSHDYMLELTYLLFLKLLQEVGREEALPPGCRWSDLSASVPAGVLDRYRQALSLLSTSTTGRVRAIYESATTKIRSDNSLRYVIDLLDRSRWHDDSRESLGDAYETLLERAAAERKSGAGQYFTPRPLVESIVALTKPEPGEVVFDPACGTGGFLVTAAEKSRAKSYVGVELVQDVARLALMNFAVHDMPGDVLVGDSLYDEGLELPQANVILTNPPFGTRGTPELRSSSRIPIPTRNKQLAFLQMVVQQLKPGGRAAVVVPDNVLFESGIAETIRNYLLETCHLHTLLRLPPGIFYATGVKTNVLFFKRRKQEATRPDEEIWIYNGRAEAPLFGKRRPLTRAFFAEFERAYGEDPAGADPRRSEHATAQFHSVPIADLAQKGFNLDLVSVETTTTGDPLLLAAEMSLRLRGAIELLSQLELELES
jgi:type I restriction enzyme M protein